MLELNKIYNGDCLEIMKDIPDGSIDLIISDVPYVCSSGGAALSSKFGSKDKAYRENRIEIFKSGKYFENNSIEFNDFLPELYRVLKETSHIYLMTNSIHLGRLQIAMQETGFNINNILVMRKNNAVVNRWFMKDCEFTIFARKGSAKAINNMSIKSVYDVKMPKDKLHPTEKPVDYFKMLIEQSTKESETVLDPFIGSGTTAISCIKTNRNYIGIEIDQQYFDIANKRIEEELSQFKLAI